MPEERTLTAVEVFRNKIMSEMIVEYSGVIMSQAQEIESLKEQIRILQQTLEAVEKDSREV